jgi:hypothetical protein
MQEPRSTEEPLMIALHGPIKHGKSTLAAILCDIEPNNLYYESSTIIAEVLNRSHQTLIEPFSSDRYVLINELLSKLPPILKDVVHIDIDPDRLRFTKEDSFANPRLHEKLLEHAMRLQKIPSLSNQEVTADNKQLYRAGLQGLGGYLVSKVGPTIWYDEIIRRARADSTDSTNLIIIGGARFPSDADVVRRAGGYIAEIFRPNAPEQDSNDPTEASRRLIQNDTKIINNGDIEHDLYAAAKKLYGDLSTGSLKPVYVADSIN